MILLYILREIKGWDIWGFATNVVAYLLAFWNTSFMCITAKIKHKRYKQTANDSLTKTNNSSYLPATPSPKRKIRRKCSSLGRGRRKVAPIKRRFEDVKRSPIGTFIDITPQTIQIPMDITDMHHSLSINPLYFGSKFINHSINDNTNTSFNRKVTRSQTISYVCHNMFNCPAESKWLGKTGTVQDICEYMKNTTYSW